jgi:hypothetical protein
MWNSIHANDLDWFRRVGPQYLTVTDTITDGFVPISWALAHVVGDSATIRDYRSRALRGDPRVANFGVGYTLWDIGWLLGLPFSDAELVFSSAEEHNAAANDLEAMGAEAGPRKGRFRKTMEYMLGSGSGWGYESTLLWTILIDWALSYPQLDSAAAIAADSLQGYLSAGAEGVHRSLIWDPEIAPCMVELFRVTHGDTVGVRAALPRLESALLAAHREGICPAMVAGLLEAQDPKQDVAPALERLASLLRRGTWVEYPTPSAIVTVARLYRQRGEYEKALEATAFPMPGAAVYYQYHIGLMREEADLSGLVGDTARAVAAYREILRHWYAPDDLGQPFVDSIQAKLAALEQAWSGHD